MEDVAVDEHAREPSSTDRARRRSGVNRIDVAAETALPPETDAGVWADCRQAYANFAEAVTEPFAEDAVRLVRLPPNASVLDVAAGTGAFTMAAARRGTRVLSTDFSADMVAHVQRRAGTLPLRNVQTAVMDGQALQLGDGQFDVAASLFGLMFFPDQARGLAELHRVLRPGGQVVVAVWAPPARVEFMRIVGEAAMSAAIDAPPAGEIPHWIELCQEKKLRSVLEATGFAKVHLVTVKRVSVFEHVSQVAQVLALSTPSSAALFEAITAAERRRCLDALMAGFRERQGDGPYAVTGEALLAVGTKPV